MAESEEEKKPTKAVTDTQNEVAGELASVLNKRFEQVSGQDKKEKGLGKFFSFGDSTKTILSSVEKSMFLQTSFLESINTTLKNTNAIAAETREDAERQANLASVSEEDSTPAPAPSSDPKSIFAALSEKFKEGKDDLRKKASDTFLGAEDDGFFKKVAKVGATAVAAGTFVAGLADNLSTKFFKKVGIGDETAEKMGDTTGNAAGLGTGASVIAMSLKKFGLKGPGGLQAFATAAVSKITYDALGALDVDGDGKILGVQKELVQGVGASLAGVGTFIATGKGFKAAGQSLSKAFGAVKSKLGIKTKIPTPKIPGTGATKVPTPKPPAVKAIKPAVAKIPGASTITTSGAASQGRPTSVRGVLGRLPADKALKFAKFFRFAGPAAAVIPALLEPALAIYRDEPANVVKKELAGALGSIGGGVLGGLAGGALGTAIFPGLGTLIGGGLGGLFGALSGEWLIEKMVGALLNGDDLDEKGLKSEVEKGEPKVAKGRGGPKKKPSEMATAKVSDAPSPKEADDGGLVNVTNDDMGLSVDEAETNLANAKAAFAQAEEDGSIYEGFTQDELQADIQFAEKDLRDANARAAAKGDFVKRKIVPKKQKSITQVAGIQSAPESLMGKSKAISDDKATQDKQSKAVVAQNLNKGGDTITNTTKGGDSTTINVLKGGNNSLGNGHIPVPQAV